MTSTSTLVKASDSHPTVTVVADGRAVATADIVENGTTVRVSFSISHGHLPMQVRRQLVDAVFEVPSMRRSRTVLASVPLGDADLLDGLRAHCATISTRAAGATCLVDATVQARDEDERPSR